MRAKTIGAMATEAAAMGSLGAVSTEATLSLVALVRGKVASLKMLKTGSWGDGNKGGKDELETNKHT